MTREQSFHSDQGVWPSRMQLVLSRSVTLLSGALQPFQVTTQKQECLGHRHVAFIQARVLLRAEDRHLACNADTATKQKQCQTPNCMKRGRVLPNVSII